MKKNDWGMFVNYHIHPKDNYTEEELNEIRANEFAMHLLMPTLYVLDEFLINDLDFKKFNDLSNCDKYLFYKRLVKRFIVPMDVVVIKIDELNNKYKNSNIDIKDIMLNEFFELYGDKKISLKDGLTKSLPYTHYILEDYVESEYGIKVSKKINKCKVLMKK